MWPPASSLSPRDLCTERNLRAPRGCCAPQSDAVCLQSLAQSTHLLDQRPDECVSQVRPSCTRSGVPLSASRQAKHFIATSGLDAAANLGPSHIFSSKHATIGAGLVRPACTTAGVPRRPIQPSAHRLQPVHALSCNASRLGRVHGSPRAQHDGRPGPTYRVWLGPKTMYGLVRPACSTSGVPRSSLNHANVSTG